MNKDEQKKLVGAAVSGDKEALDRLIVDRRKDIVYIASRYIKNKSMLEDAAQNAITEIYTHITSLRNPDVFDSWMYRVVMLVCKNTNRDSNVRIHIPFDEAMGKIEEERAEFLPQEFSVNRENIRLLAEEFSRLPSHYQEVLFLKYYMSMSYVDIANLLEMSEVKLGGVMARARKKLKSRLEKRTGRRLTTHYMLSVAPVPVLSIALQEMVQNFQTSDLGDKSWLKDTRQHKGRIRSSIIIVGVACLAIGGIAYTVNQRSSFPEKAEPDKPEQQEAQIQEQPEEPETPQEPMTIESAEEPIEQQETENNQTASAPVSRQTRQTYTEAQIDNSALYDIIEDPSEYDPGNLSDPETGTNNTTLIIEGMVDETTLTSEGVKTGDSGGTIMFAVLMLSSLAVILRLKKYQR